LEYPKNITKLNPFMHLLKIKTWGTEWKRIIDKTMEWATQQWANVNMDQKNLFIMKQSVNISKDDMED
jgi:hypothetical protein